MGYQELIAALEAEGERTIGQLRDAAARKREEIAREADAAVALLTAEQERDAAAQAKRAVENAVSAAAAEARALKTAAENDLAAKLYTLAGQCLEGLRNKQDDAGFNALVKDIPDHAWGTVRVNPADRERAETRFPGTVVVPDARITGGAEVCSSDGAVCVVSTFEKMLEMAWPFILPGIMADIRKGGCK